MREPVILAGPGDHQCGVGDIAGNMRSHNGAGSRKKWPARPNRCKNGCRPAERSPPSAGISQKSDKIGNNGAGQKPGRQNSSKVFNAPDDEKNEKRPDNAPDNHLVCVSETGEVKRQKAAVNEKLDKRSAAKKRR